MVTMLKSPFRIYKDSRIVKKLIKRILIIEAASFLIVMVLSVFILNPLVKEQAVKASGEVISQMTDKIDATIESLTVASHFIINSNELRSALKAFDSMKTNRTRGAISLILNNLVTSQPNIRGIVLEDEDFTRFDSITILTQDDFSVVEAPWYQNVRRMDYSQGYSVLYGSTQDPIRKTLAYARNCYIGSRSFILTVYYDTSNLLRELQRLSQNSFSGYAVIDRSGTVIYQEGDISINGEALEIILAGGTVKSTEGVYFTDMVQTNMWYVVSYAENSIISSFYSGYLWATFTLFILLSILTVLLIIPAIYHIIRPISTLSQTMRRAADGDLSTIPAFDTKDEIGDLSNVFNKMANHLQAFIQRQLEHEKKEQKMKYSLLISQIDPHFIYNTMSIINSLARNKQTDDIVMINNALITILQDRLRVNTIEVFDTVRQELDILKQYLVIQNRRYENHAVINFEIGEDIQYRQIPKNIIQPLVENALFHGLLDDETGDIQGVIDIIIREDDDALHIIVRDNGRGADMQKISECLTGAPPDQNSRGRHIGLYSIFERLTYLYGRRDCIQIENNKGTTVTISLPLSLPINSTSQPIDG